MKRPQAGTQMKNSRRKWARRNITCKHLNLHTCKKYITRCFVQIAIKEPWEQLEAWHHTPPLSSDVRRWWVEVQLMPCRWMWTTIPFPWYRWENFEWGMMIIVSSMSEQPTWTWSILVRVRGFMFISFFYFLHLRWSTQYAYAFTNKSGVIPPAAVQPTKQNAVSLESSSAWGCSAGCARAHKYGKEPGLRARRSPNVLKTESAQCSSWIPNGWIPLSVRILNTEDLPAPRCWYIIYLYIWVSHFPVCVMSLDKGTCRDDGFNYGAASMNSRNATDFGPWGAARFGFASLRG